jgi:hypothetical protein
MGGTRQRARNGMQCRGRQAAVEAFITVVIGSECAILV